ncbi:hypothetical protein EW026_g2487 [Hermanssonia centrifuga]|uniref:Indoleamine 2,3-dioxygenase n=1 Tax=Hermanssonia centrifuga TaxID=98765 RepID=A0A4V3XAZ5_9APHY|nr:hypothetical protein EW026_g2487 [Hermanssonia centrifuga]
MNIASSPLHLMNLLGSVANVKTFARSLTSSLMQEKTFCPQHYDVDPNTGCFPPEPLPQLPRPFSFWENALAEVQGVLYLGNDESDEALDKREAGENWRAQVRSWPVIETTVLHENIRYLQKAHMVLAFIMHFYVHSTPPTEDNSPIHIPRAICVPLVAVSQALGTAPVLTFADTVLWNWTFINPELPLSADNIRYVTLLSGTDAERAFYEVSGIVELKGVEMLQIIESFMLLPNTTDYASVAKISRDLSQLKKIVEELTDIFLSIRDAVDPKAFHWQCRPWWSGAPAPSSSQPEWIFEGVPKSATVDVSGPSAGQSTVMHALDVFLDIDHRLTQKRQPAPSESNKKADTGFMERMRRYMPRLHREYLARIGDVPQSVREVANATPTLREPYNAAVAALKRLRDVHIRIVTLYVVTMSHSAPPTDIKRKIQEEGIARGTGGNEASSLLKAGRDATTRAMLKD